jgi:competence protein ComEC
MRLVYITLGWITGITCAMWFPQIDSSFWGIGSVLALILTVILYRFSNMVTHWLGIILVALMLGGLRQSLMPQTTDLAQYNGNSGTVEGIVIDEPDIRDDRIQLRVEAESIFTNSDTFPTYGQILVETFILTDVKYGDRIRATGALITPAEWDTFSYADYLGRQGVFTIMPYAGVNVLESGYGNAFFASLIDLKHIVQGQIALALPEPQAGLLMGILLGNERGISPELADDFSRVGAAHIIAISGFNMVIVSAIVMHFFEAIFKERKWLAALAGILVIAVYTIFVGANVAVVRAALMSGLLVIAPLFKRKTYVPASLALVTILLTLSSPAVLQDIGFQLSFMAVLGLALFADPLSTRFKTFLERRFPSTHANLIHVFLNEPLIISIAAQITTLPLVLLYFGRLSLLSIPVNVLIVPVQSILLIIAMMAVGTSFFIPAVGTVLYWIDMVFLSWSIGIVRTFARLEFADVAVSIDGRLIQAYYMVLMGVAMVTATRPPWWIRLENLLRRQMVVVSIGLVGISVSILMFGMFSSRPDGQLHVWMLDMGHSHAVFVQTPNGAHMLVDGGRFPSRLLTALGDKMPYFDREIEILAITHPDEFDIGALNAVLERYTVGVALFNGQPNQTDTFLEIQERLANTQTMTVRAGYTIQLDDGVLIEVLHPQVEPTITDSLNDHTMVLRITFDGISILLTSDLSTKGQLDMIEHGVSPTSSVMNIPQHATIRALNKDFLALAQPQIAIIQSDRANRRGDPDADTVAMLGDIPIFRTDESGTLHLSSDGESVWIVGDQ